MTELHEMAWTDVPPVHALHDVGDRYELDLGRLEQEYDRVALTPHMHPDGYTISFSYDTDVYGPLVRDGCRNAIRETTGPYRDDGLDDAALQDLMLEAEESGHLFLGSLDIPHDASRDAVQTAYAAVEDRISRVAAMHDAYTAVADRY